MLRVAYDISFLADVAEREHAVTGISRATEAVLERLSTRRELDLSVTGLAGADPYTGAARVGRYARRSALTLTVERGYSTRFAPSRLYDRLADASGSPRPTAGAARALLKGLKIADGTPGLRRNAYDVFHSTFLPLPPHALTAGAARVLTVYDLIPLRNPEYATKTQREMLAAILRSLDAERDTVIAISEYVKRDVCESIDLDEHRVVVAPLAAGDAFSPAGDAAVRELRGRLGLGHAPYLLSLAASQPHKNLVGVIRAYVRHVEERPESALRLVLAGLGGREVLELERHPDQRRRIDRIGFVAERDLATLYSGAAAFLFLSRAEGFGLPPLEAMSCGAPVVVSNRASLPEVVGGAAIVVDPDDVAEVVRALHSILDDDDRASSLRKRGLARSAELTWERTAAATAAAYRLALDRA